MKFYPVDDAINSLQIGSLLQFLEKINSRLSIFIFAYRSTEGTVDGVFTSVSTCNSTRAIVDEKMRAVKRRRDLGIEADRRC